MHTVLCVNYISIKLEDTKEKNNSSGQVCVVYVCVGCCVFVYVVYLGIYV